MRDEQRMAELTLEFLKRSELKGSEVGAYVEVNNWLTSIMLGANEAEDGHGEDVYRPTEDSWMTSSMSGADEEPSHA